MAAKSANVMARVEPEIKERAETILAELGIPVSVAINMMYRQIIAKNGVPFSLTLPAVPACVEDMSKDQFNAMMEKGLTEAKTGEGILLQDAFAQLRDSI